MRASSRAEIFAVFCSWRFWVRKCSAAGDGCRCRLRLRSCGLLDNYTIPARRTAKALSSFRTNQILAKHSIINLFNSLFALWPFCSFFSLTASLWVHTITHQQANSHKAPPRVLQLCDLNLITIQYFSIKIYYQKLYTWNHNLAQFISAPIFARSSALLGANPLPHSFSPNVHLFCVGGALY